MRDRPRKSREEGGSKSRVKGERKIKRREKKCLDEESVFNRTTRKCERCDPCGDGRGRDFSDPASLERADNDGSHVCPSCHECPAGTYNNAKYAVTCTNCVVNCKSRNRLVDTQCWRLGDTACGGCEKGYYDYYGNQDMPCEKILPSPPAPTLHVPIRVTDGVVRNVSSAAQELPNKAIDNSYRVGTAEAQHQLPVVRLSNGTVLAITLSGLVTGVLILLAVAAVWYLRRQRQERKTRSHIRRRELNRRGSRSFDPIVSAEHGQFPSATSTARSSMYNPDLGQDNDIEFDAVGVVETDVVEDVGERLALYYRQHSREGQYPYRVASNQVRAEISEHSGPLGNPMPRPELFRANSIEQSSETSPGLEDVPVLFSAGTSLLSSSSDTQCYSQRTEHPQGSRAEHPQGARTDHPQEARAELQSASTSGDAYAAGPEPVHPVPPAAANDGSSTQHQLPSSRRHCPCRPSTCCRLCSGPLSNTCADISITKNSKILSKVATDVCHNPIDLYKKLCIPVSIIFQIDDDRYRDPERIPMHENIMTMLNRWVELKDRGEATLPVLCKALCESDFHNITEKIHETQKHVQSSEP